MTIWQRAIAIILLTVFTPVAVLAGTSLKLCVGDNGHRAIEFVVAAQHHGAAEAADAVRCENRSDGRHSVPECSDAPLLSVAQNSNASTKIKQSVSFDDFLAAVLIPLSYQSTSFDDLYGRRIVWPSTTHRDAQLDAMRTVVLLI